MPMHHLSMILIRSILKLGKGALSLFAYTLSIKIFLAAHTQGIEVCCYFTYDPNLTWDYFDINVLSSQFSSMNEGFLLKTSRTWRLISNLRERQNLLWLITFFYILPVLTSGNMFKLKNQDLTFPFISEFESSLRQHVTYSIKGMGNKKYIYKTEKTVIIT